MRQLIHQIGLVPENYSWSSSSRSGGKHRVCSACTVRVNANPSHSGMLPRLISQKFDIQLVADHSERLRITSVVVVVSRDGDHVALHQKKWFQHLAEHFRS